ncbi:hypothetical protein ACLM5H_08590 [Fredinandcohnia humi]
MGLFSLEISTEDLVEIIDEVISSFHSTIKCRLDIEEMEYKIVKKSYPYGIDGFVKENTRASLVPSSIEYQVKELVFYTENIKKFIDYNFFRLTDLKIFYEAVRTTIKFIVAHELVHVQQIKNGLTIEEYKKTSYCDSIYERQANEIASIIVSEDGEFQRKIAKLITNKNEKIDNDNVIEYIRAFG